MNITVLPGHPTYLPWPSTLFPISWTERHFERMMISDNSRYYEKFLTNSAKMPLSTASRSGSDTGSSLLRAKRSTLKEIRLPRLYVSIQNYKIKVLELFEQTLYLLKHYNLQLKLTGLTMSTNLWGNCDSWNRKTGISWTLNTPVLWKYDCYNKSLHIPQSHNDTFQLFIMINFHSEGVLCFTQIKYTCISTCPSLNSSF